MSPCSVHEWKFNSNLVSWWHLVARMWNISVTQVIDDLQFSKCKLSHGGASTLFHMYTNNEILPKLLSYHVTLLTLVKIKTARNENANWFVESGTVAATPSAVINNVGLPADQCGAPVLNGHKSAAVRRSSIPADRPESCWQPLNISECVPFLQQSFWFQGFLKVMLLQLEWHQFHNWSASLRWLYCLSRSLNISTTLGMSSRAILFYLQGWDSFH